MAGGDVALEVLLPRSRSTSRQRTAASSTTAPDDMPSTSLAAVEEKNFLVDQEKAELPQWTASEKAKSRLIDGLWVALNTIATIVIVFMNK